MFDIFGFPLNLTNQIKIKARTNENVYDERVKTLGFSNTDAMRAKHLPQLFLRFPKGGDGFKKLFVLYTVSILLASLPDFKIRKTVYSAIANPTSINSFDWCSFTVEILCDTVRRVNGDNRINFVNGCVLVLLVCYCYRFPFRGRDPRSLPLVQHLNEKLLKSRFEVERVVEYSKAIMVLEGLPITHQYTDWCNGIAQEVEDMEGVNPSVTEMPLPDMAGENDEQEVRVQDLPVNEPTADKVVEL